MMWISSIFCRLILSREFVSNHLVSGINGLSLLIRPCLLYQDTNWNTSQHQSAIRLSFISWLAQTNSFFDLHHTFYLFPFFIVFFSGHVRLRPSAPFNRRYTIQKHRLVLKQYCTLHNRIASISKYWSSIKLSVVLSKLCK